MRINRWSKRETVGLNPAYCRIPDKARMNLCQLRGEIKVGSFLSDVSRCALVVGIGSSHPALTPVYPRHFALPEPYWRAAIDLYRDMILSEYIGCHGLNLAGSVEAICSGYSSGLIGSLLPLFRGASNSGGRIRYSRSQHSGLLSYGSVLQRDESTIPASDIDFLLPGMIQRIDEVQDCVLEEVYTIGQIDGRISHSGIYKVIQIAMISVCSMRSHGVYHCSRRLSTKVVLVRYGGEVEARPCR